MALGVLACTVSCLVELTLDTCFIIEVHSSWDRLSWERSTRWDVCFSQMEASICRQPLEMGHSSSTAMTQWVFNPNTTNQVSIVLQAPPEQLLHFESWKKHR